MKKIITTFLLLSLLTTSLFGVTANAQSSKPSIRKIEYKQTFSKPNDVFKLYFSEENDNLESKLQLKPTNEFRVIQKVQENVYTDNSVEETYVIDTLLVLDEQMKKVDNTKSVIYEDGFFAGNNSKYYVYGSHRMYITIKTDGLIKSFKLIKITSMAANEFPTTWCTKIYHEFTIIDGAYEYSKGGTINNPASGTWYTKLTGDTTYYGALGGALGNCFQSFATFTLNNGHTFDIELPNN